MKCEIRDEHFLVGPSWNFAWCIATHALFMLVGPYRLGGPTPRNMLQVFLLDQEFWLSEIASCDFTADGWKTPGDEEVIAIMRRHPMLMIERVAMRFPPPEELCATFDIDWVDDADVDREGVGHLHHLPFCSVCEQQLELCEDVEFDYGSYMEAMAEMHMENQIDEMRLEGYGSFGVDSSD